METEAAVDPASTSDMLLSHINWGPLALYLAATFFVCGIPFGKIIARTRGVDIQKVGSGNIGTTNVAREIGKGAAALTLALDAGKGALATGLASVLFARPGFVLAADGVDVSPTGAGGWLVALVMVAAVWGHIFSPFLHFHGGKGIAVGVGSLLGFVWPVGLIELGIFIVLVVITKRVSVGSVTVAAILGGVCALFYGPNLPLDLVVELAGLTVVWAHRTNIKKLLAGQESAFSFHKKGEPVEPVASETGANAADGRDGGER